MIAALSSYVAGAVLSNSTVTGSVNPVVSRAPAFQPAPPEILYMVTVSVPLPVTLRVPVPSVVIVKVSYAEDETSLIRTIPDPPEPPYNRRLPPPPPACVVAHPRLVLLL